MTDSPQAPREYVEARRALLDALEALEPHASAVVVCGAQAIYLRTGGSALPISDFTTDGDLALNPLLLGDEPTLDALMTGAEFELAILQGAREPGIWQRPVSGGLKDEMAQIDLIVPTGAAPPGGTRGARLGPHGKRAARKASGLEATLVDNDVMRVESLDPADRRSARVSVAGFAALLVAKAHKLRDRLEHGREDRLDDKDASDVVQIMSRASPTEMAATLARLREHPIAGAPTQLALEQVRELFGNRAGAGIAMAIDALEQAMPAERVRAICLAFTKRLGLALQDQASTP